MSTLGSSDGSFPARNFASHREAHRSPDASSLAKLGTRGPPSRGLVSSPEDSPLCFNDPTRLPLNVSQLCTLITPRNIQPARTTVPRTNAVSQTSAEAEGDVLSPLEWADQKSAVRSESALAVQYGDFSAGNKQDARVHKLRQINRYPDERVGGSL